MIILSKIYSRERPLFDFRSWDECDRSGVRKYLGEELSGGIFIDPPRGQRGEVWYSDSELERLSKIAAEKSKNPEFLKIILSDANNAFKKIKPYVEGQKIQSVPEMLDYEEEVMSLWSALNTIIIELPNHPEVDTIFAKEILKFRELTQEYTEPMMAKFVEYVKEYFPQLSDCAYHIAPADIVKYLKEKGETLKELVARANRGCFVSEGKIIVIDGLEAELSRRNISLGEIDIKNLNEVVGKSAFPGLVTGRVRVVSIIKDLSKVEAGDIIVASMTSPNFLPALKKAVALVTDEGGIICHAAIVARELKKPCVIGTKIATKVLKDGDMVEVDANNGVVKIIK